MPGDAAVYAVPSFRWRHLVLLTAIIIARNPDALLHPQFWAEDGKLWYEAAYNLGPIALFQPALGYLQTLSRLSAAAALAFPLAWAPAIYAVIALCIQVLPAVIWLSARLDRAVPYWPARLALAYFYVLMPNSFEWNMNVTNAQWHLAIAAFLILIGAQATSPAARIADPCVILISGLSGPFSIFYAPFALWEVARNGQRVLYAVLAFIAAGIQLACLFTTISARPTVHLHASVPALCQILTHQIFMGGILGAHLTRLLVASPVLGSAALAIPLTLAAIALGLIAVRTGSAAYTKFLLFAVCLVAPALMTPATLYDTWPAMAQPGDADRYFIMPILAWFATLVALLASKTIARQAAFALLILGILGIVFDWPYPADRPTGFTDRAMAFAAAAPGTTITFPENPAGWSMTLTKHAP